MSRDNLLIIWRAVFSVQKLDEISRLDVVEIAPVAWHASELVSFLVGAKDLSAPRYVNQKLDEISRLDVVEIARVPDMLPSLFPSWSGLRNYQHPGT